MKLKLKEIIWEVTGRCDNHCSYCGSKENWAQNIDEDKIRAIADKIAEYPPEEIDISGGDPLLVGYDTHKYIVGKLPNTKCKILINPLSMANENQNYKKQLLQLYYHVGISINTKEELEKFKEVSLSLPRFTIITNFNLTNFFLFNEIAKAVSQYGCVWQIQFTMYKKKDHELALYNYPEALAKLNEDIQKQPNLKYIFADNANPGHCVAGMSSLGILSNGDIIPCLSMRSWCDLAGEVEGNILNPPCRSELEPGLGSELQHIWMTRFRKNRFDDCICCKDICKKQLLKYPENKTNLEPPQVTVTPVYGVTYPTPIIPSNPYPFNPKHIGVTAYAVQIEPFGILQQTIDNFPPQQPPIAVTLYGVSTSSGSSLTSCLSDFKKSQAYAEFFAPEEKDKKDKT